MQWLGLRRKENLGCTVRGMLSHLWTKIHLCEDKYVSTQTCSIQLCRQGHQHDHKVLKLSHLHQELSVDCNGSLWARERASDRDTPFFRSMLLTAGTIIQAETHWLEITVDSVHFLYNVQTSYEPIEATHNETPQSRNVFPAPSFACRGWTADIGTCLLHGCAMRALGTS